MRLCDSMGHLVQVSSVLLVSLCLGVLCSVRVYIPRYTSRHILTEWFVSLLLSSRSLSLSQNKPRHYPSHDCVATGRTRPRLFTTSASMLSPGPVYHSNLYALWRHSSLAVVESKQSNVHLSRVWHACPSQDVSRTTDTAIGGHSQVL
jgi:hypothetical protein